MQNLRLRKILQNSTIRICGKKGNFSSMETKKSLSKNSVKASDQTKMTYSKDGISDRYFFQYKITMW